MKKLLRTIRFDETDPRVFAIAADAGEWAVPGGFTFAGLAADAVVGKTKQAFANGFLGITSFGYATFATVGECTAAEEAAVIEAFAARLVADYGAPDIGAARAAAREELAFAADLCAAVPINTVFTVRRTMATDGAIKEEFRTIQPPAGEQPHARVWRIETDRAD